MIDDNSQCEEAYSFTRIKDATPEFRDDFGKSAASFTRYVPISMSAFDNVFALSCLKHLSFSIGITTTLQLVNVGKKWTL